MLHGRKVGALLYRGGKVGLELVEQLPGVQSWETVKKRLRSCMPIGTGAMTAISVK